MNSQSIPPGRPSQLVEFLSMRGGQAHIEEVIGVLWPTATIELGHKRVSHVLGRLGGLVVRHGESLVLK